MAATSEKWLQEVAETHPELVPPLLALLENFGDRSAMQASSPFGLPQGMCRSRRFGNLVRALAKAQAEFLPIAKDKSATVKLKTGGEYEYGYADLASVFNSVRTPLNKYGVFVTQFLDFDDQAKQAIVVTILMRKEEWLQSEFRFPSATFNIQELGSLYTYMRRYSLTAILGIAAEVDDDDGASHRDSARREAKEAKRQRKEQRQDEGRPQGEQQERPQVNLEQTKPFIEFCALAKTIFKDWDAVLQWFSREGLENQTPSDYSKAHYRLKKQGSAAAESRTTIPGQPAEEPDPKIRNALQKRWMSVFQGKGLDQSTACWWAGFYFEWVHDEQKGRPSAKATELSKIRAAVDALAKMDEAGVEGIRQAYAEHLEDVRLANEPPAEEAPEAPAAEEVQADA